MHQFHLNLYAFFSLLRCLSTLFALPVCQAARKREWNALNAHGMNRLLVFSSIHIYVRLTLLRLPLPDHCLKVAIKITAHLSMPAPNAMSSRLPGYSLLQFSRLPCISHHILALRSRFEFLWPFRN
jgi:hypothetical protein